MKNIIFVEDGSVDIEDLEKKLKGTNAEVVIYRSGSKLPFSILVQEGSDSVEK